MGEQRYCSKCRKTMADTNFYTYKDGTKCELCKPCLTMHINNYEPDSFLQLLEKFDVPYIPHEWNVLRDRAYAKDPYKMNGMSVFGKYLSKMKLRQQKEFHQADTEMLKVKAEEEAKLYGQPQEQAEIQIEEMRKAYENGEISEAQQQTYAEINKPDAPPELPPPPHQEEQEKGNSLYPVNGGYEEVELVDVGAELTQEDKVYLAMKWGRLYHADEQVSLEKLYEEFKNSFDIQGAAREDTLKMICKTSLKMNQAIDCGDIESYQKLSRVYDAMMKSAKFTEAQRKEEKSGEFDSVGQIVYFAEKEKGKIPRFKSEVPLDIVDEAIENLKRYTHDLIVNDTSLSQMLENLIKRHENREAEKKNLQEAADTGLDHLELENEDYTEFNDLLELQKEIEKEKLKAQDIDTEIIEEKEASE